MDSNSGNVVQFRIMTPDVHKQFIKRFLKLTKNYSFFLFGPRNTGKSSLLKKVFDDKTTLFIDLLEPEMENRFSVRPGDLISIVESLPKEISFVVLDEIQKVPKLLDCVHYLIEKTEKHFALTGSSSRKLKSGNVNLLAGRAFTYHLYNFSFLELKSDFNLNEALEFGLLPKIFSFSSREQKNQFLQAYSNTYLKEEIWHERFIKNLDPFRKFLEVAAQSNGKIINYANIAYDCGVNEKTVKNYFSILEDTLIGFFLPAFHHSFRKRLNTKPKFYFFDGGVTRALARTLTQPLVRGNSLYGDAFEQFIILECVKLASYFHSEYTFSYLRTRDDVEADLVVERPGQPLLLIEIKSADRISEKALHSFIKITKELKECEAVCFCQDKLSMQCGHVKTYYWANGIEHFFAKNQLEAGEI